MNDKKLKPEHRKLWRRIYLDEFEGRGMTPEESEVMADKVVAQWERRGAFDDSETIPHTSASWAIVARELKAKSPEALDHIFEKLVEAERQAQGTTPDEVPVLSDAERLARLRDSLSAGATEVTFNGIPAGLVTQWEETNDPNKPVVRLRMTVESFFSILR